MADKKLKQTQGGSWSYSDPKLRQYLIERMKRNQDLGLEPSPENTDILYNAALDDNTRGEVPLDASNRIYINPKTSDSESSLKSTIAHELDHVNALNAEKNPETSRYTSKDKQDKDYNYSSNLHEDPKYIDKHIEAFDNQGRDEERRRILYSITHPFSENRPAPYENFVEGHNPLFKDGKPVFSRSILEKYAKEAGVPVDEIVDAMVMNSAVRTDKLDRKSTRLNSSHTDISRMPSSA